MLHRPNPFVLPMLDGFGCHAGAHIMPTIRFSRLQWRACLGVIVGNA